jgi:hypothetical protein
MMQIKIRKEELRVWLEKMGRKPDEVVESFSGKLSTWLEMATADYALKLVDAQGGEWDTFPFQLDDFIVCTQRGSEKFENDMVDLAVKCGGEYAGT